MVIRMYNFLRHCSHHAWVFYIIIKMAVFSREGSFATVVKFFNTRWLVYTFRSIRNQNYERIRIFSFRAERSHFDSPTKLFPDLCLIQTFGLFNKIVLFRVCALHLISISLPLLCYWTIQIALETQLLIADKVSVCLRLEETIVH